MLIYIINSEHFYIHWNSNPVILINLVQKQINSIGIFELDRTYHEIGGVSIFWKSVTTV